MSSPSESFRTQGNALYTKGCDPERPPSMQSANLIEALRLFQQARNSARTAEEMLKATKNIFMANWRLAICGLNREQFDAAKYHLSEGVKHASEAIAQGERVMGDQWTLDLDIKRQECIKTSLQHPHGVALCFALTQELPRGPYRSESLLEVAVTLYRKALVLPLDAPGFPVLSLLEECYRPIEEARHCGDMPVIKGLEGDINHLRMTCESVRNRVNGDKFLEKAVHGAEELDMGYIRLAMDEYKQGEVLARAAGSAEHEARNVLRMAYVHHKVLCQTMRAKELYTHSFHLLGSTGRNFNTAWYCEARDSLQTIRDAEEKEEAKAKKEAQSRYREKYKEELEAISSMANKDAYSLLRFIYKDFPPEKGSLDEELLAPEKLKEALMKAIVHYHPDRCVTSPPEKRFLYEEITKVLTVKYEIMKA